MLLRKNTTMRGGSATQLMTWLAHYINFT